MIYIFKNLTNFEYKRTPKEAVGFYIVYLVIFIMLAVISAAVLGSATGNENNGYFGLKVGSTLVIVLVVLLAFLILNKKNLMGNFSDLFLALLSGVLAYFGGGLLGLIPIAYLSTKKASK